MTSKETKKSASKAKVRKKTNKPSANKSTNLSADESLYDELEQSFKKRGLGRGLNALFENEEGVYPQPDKDGHTPGAQRRLIETSNIEPGSYQPRTIFDDKKIAELAKSMQEHGVLQPLLVRKKDGASGVYEIIAGERRWRAAMKARLHEIPVIIKDFTDKEALEIGIIENLQREDLNPLDEAYALKRLMEEFSYTQEEASEAVGKSRSYVANMVRLTKLPEEVLKFMWDGALSAGHGRALITSKDPVALAKTIIEGNLSVREAENLSGGARKTKNPSTKKSAKKAKEKDVDHLALERNVSESLGLAVSIDMTAYSAGALSVDFKDFEQLDFIVKKLVTP